MDPAGYAESLDQGISRLASADAFSGVVLVTIDGQVVLHEAYGLANRSDRIANTRDTRFGTASITKMFTAVAVARLVQDGLLTFDTPIRDCLGEASGKIDSRVTLHHLLCHTSGIGDYYDEKDRADGYARVWEETPLYRMRRPVDFLPLFASKPAQFSPGERFVYCSAGYILLGLAVEAASGRSYHDFVRQCVFARAEMTASDFLEIEAVHPQVATGYIPSPAPAGAAGTGWKANYYALPPVGGPDGGAYCTALDLHRFFRALQGSQLLDRERTRRLMTTHVPEEPDWFYGYGIYLGSVAGRPMMGHTGEDPGFSARLWHLPQMDATMVVLANMSEAAGQVTDLILETFPLT
jgi:CubicO group peptidase (beta-lactamase class C family)